MQRQLPLKKLYLDPGALYCTREPAKLFAVLGYCVCVCVWDNNLAYGAMGHYELPFIGERDKATARYGNIATAALVNMMVRLGSRPLHLEAQIIGGGIPRENPDMIIGQRNVEIARKVFKRKGVAICSEDVGGLMGRKLVYDTATGHLMVMKVHNIRQDDWEI